MTWISNKLYFNKNKKSSSLTFIIQTVLAEMPAYGKPNCTGIISVRIYTCITIFTDGK